MSGNSDATGHSCVREPRSDATGRSLARALTAAAVGVYLLVVAGATAAVADAAAACGTWPACEGPLTLADPALLVARGHRVAAALVGVLVLAGAAIAWRRPAPSRVRAAATAAAALYPLQVGIGALAAVRGAPDGLAAAHLAVGVGIFGGVVLALGWQLEAETADANEPIDDGGPSARAAPARAEPVRPPSAADEGVPSNGETAVASNGTTAASDGATATAAPKETTATAVPSETTATTAPTPSGGLGELARAYVRLTKPKLWWLLCLVAAAAMALAAANGADLTVRTVVLTLGGGVLAIGSAGTFNHVLERDVDRKMARTADRPLATDVVPVRNAVAFGVLLAAAALAAFLQVNPLAAGLGLTAILFYSVVYTLVLKPNTVQNTVIGGAAGALPALIGWAAVTDGVGLPGLVLAGVIFLWTPAHFYNLAMAHREDYERGGFPMLPVVRGAKVARKHVLWYLAATLVAAAALTWLTALGWLYAAATVGLGAVFLWTVLRLHRERTRAAAMRAFHASNAYLGGLLLAVVVDALAV